MVICRLLHFLAYDGSGEGCFSFFSCWLLISGSLRCSEYVVYALDQSLRCSECVMYALDESFFVFFYIH